MPGVFGGAGGSAATGGATDTDSARKEVTFLIASAAANTTIQGNRVSGNTNYHSYPAKRAGQLTGISALVNSNPSGSTALVRVSVDSGAGAVVDSTLTLEIPAGTTRDFSITGSGVSFNAGDVLRAVLITDASWTNATMITTVDLELTEVIV